MATDIVSRLFGVTTDSYQQEQQDRMDKNAFAVAQLDPFQQANYNINRGGSMLGGAVGGMLGGQDPMLQRISMRQQIAGQINPNDLDSFRSGIEMMRQGGDGEGAFMLNQELQKILVNQSKIAKNEAQATQALAASNKDRAPPPTATTNDITNARALALQEGPEGSPEYNAKFKDALTIFTTKAAPLDPRFGVDRESVAMANFGKSFAQLTQNEQVLVNKSVEDSKGKTAAQGAPTITNVLPGVAKASDVTGLVNSINQAVKPYRDNVNEADLAIGLANEVLKTGNFAAFATVIRKIAKSSGELQLSKGDISAFGGDPSFVGSIADMASKLATGTPTADTVRKLKDLAVLIKKKNQALVDGQIQQLQITAGMSGNFTEDQIKKVFTLNGKTKGATRKTAGGVSYTVED